MIKINSYKKGYLLVLFILSGFLLYGQHNLSSKLNKLPSYHLTSGPIHMPTSLKNGLTEEGNIGVKKSLGNSGTTIELSGDMFQYKFTGGNWDTADSAVEDTLIENHNISVEKDTTIGVEIGHWIDNLPFKTKESTASKNVRILDTTFFIPQLNRHRRIWLYLPSSYCSTKKSYPVLYMQDGQNVFDDATSYSGEWGVDEALDSLGPRLGEMIVVAIDNGREKRINEYSPFEMQEHGKGEGDAYTDFIVQTLIPYINKHYRTKRSRSNTFIAGSSMGGLISLYALLKYPNKFGGAGVFSPAIWIAPQIKEYARQQAAKVKGKIYFFAGQKESESMIPNLLSVFDEINVRSKAEIKTVIRADGTHSEGTWRAEFPEFYKWLVDKN